VRGAARTKRSAVERAVSLLPQPPRPTYHRAIVARANAMYGPLIPHISRSFAERTTTASRTHPARGSRNLPHRVLARGSVGALRRTSLSAAPRGASPRDDEFAERVSLCPLSPSGLTFSRPARVVLVDKSSWRTRPLAITRPAAFIGGRAHRHERPSSGPALCDRTSGRRPGGASVTSRSLLQP
jgi:hypothetical protein